MYNRWPKYENLIKVAELPVTMSNLLAHDRCPASKSCLCSESRSFFIILDACCSFACNFKEVLEGKMKGNRRPCRMRISMIDDLFGKEQYGVLKRRTEDRQEWRVWRFFSDSALKKKNALGG